VSRSTGKVYFFNSTNGASTYDPADIMRLSAPPPPVQQMPPPQILYPMSNINMMKLSGQNNNQAELSMDHSVTELQMLLAEKKRQLDQKMRELEGGGEEVSSEESGFGSLGGEAEEEFPSVIGARVKRRVDLWHQQVQEVESREKRLREDSVMQDEEIESGEDAVMQNEEVEFREDAVMQNDDHVEMSSTVEDAIKEKEFEEAEETDVEPTKELAERSIEGEDREDSDEEDIYGADEEELEQIAKLKEKHTKEPEECQDKNNGHHADSDPVVDAEGDEELPVDDDDVLLLNTDVSFGEVTTEAKTISKENSDRHKEVQINNVPSTKGECEQNMHLRPLADDLMSSNYLGEQTQINRDLQSASLASNIAPDMNDGASTKSPEPMQLPLTDAVTMPEDPKFSSDEESGEENSSGQDE